VSQVSSEEKELVNICDTVVTALIVCSSNTKQVTKIYINDKLFTLDFPKNECDFVATIQKQRIEQVWIILINNALDELVKIEPFESRRLDIKIKQDGKNVIVEFSDNAGGINESIMKNIFDPFISTKSSGGLGIGLNLAKKIIDEHKGLISVQNIDDGALFRIVFTS